MNSIGLQLAAPLAQGRLDSLGGRFRHGGGDLDWLTMLLVVVVLATAIAIVWLVARYLSIRESGRYHNHRALFRELCRAHRLGWNDRRLLVMVARRQDVVVPARLFIEPDRWAPERFEHLSEKQRRHLARLYETLFSAES